MRALIKVICSAKRLYSSLQLLLKSLKDDNARYGKKRVTNYELQVAIMSFKWWVTSYKLKT